MRRRKGPTKTRATSAASPGSPRSHRARPARATSGLRRIQEGLAAYRPSSEPTTRFGVGRSLPVHAKSGPDHPDERAVRANHTVSARSRVSRSAVSSSRASSANAHRRATIAWTSRACRLDVELDRTPTRCPAQAWATGSVAHRPPVAQSPKIKGDVVEASIAALDVRATVGRVGCCGQADSNGDLLQGRESRERNVCFCRLYPVDADDEVGRRLGRREDVDLEIEPLVCDGCREGRLLRSAKRARVGFGPLPQPGKVFSPSMRFPSACSLEPLAVRGA